MKPDDFVEFFYTIRNDDALSGMMFNRHPSLAKDLGDWLRQTNRKPLSSIRINDPNDITALEISIFDNWPDGKPVKHKPNRYGFSINATTKRALDFEDWPLHFSGLFMNGDMLADRVARLQSPKRTDPISKDYAEFILAFSDVYGPNALVGLLESRQHGEGTVLPEFHVLVIELEETSKGPKVRRAELWAAVEAAPIVVQSFVPSCANGKPLSGKAVRQARWGRGDLFYGWRTCTNETAKPDSEVEASASLISCDNDECNSDQISIKGDI